jgi:predicted protein tyrosine phosphatase
MLHHPRLVILGYSEAAMFARGADCRSIAAIISIHGAREFGVDHPVAHRLDLSFDDIEVIGDANDVMAMQRASTRRRWADQIGLVEVPPTPADAQRIIEFANEIRDVEGNILCHCGAGISRSPAAALICLAVWKGVDTELECAEEVLRLRRGAVPHVDLVRFADELLNRGGKLASAVTIARLNNSRPR